LTLATGVEPYSTTEEQLENCREQTERQYQSTLGIHCWDQWYANATCALRQTDYCPCDADSGHCVFSPRAYSFSPACNETYFLFLDCAVTLGNVAGSAGTFTFEQSDAGCFVQGLAANGVDKIEAHCTGPRGGLQDCTCVKNGAELGGQGVSFLGHGCTNVAQLVSSGECSGPQPRCVGGPAR
jgi:hypothetical protein